MQPKRYEIWTIRDLLKVPEARRGVCLEELGTWLKMHEPLRDLFTVDGNCLVTWDGGFRWIDDDKRDVKITLKPTNAPEGEA